MNIFTAILLGMAVAIVARIVYMIVRIIRFRTKEMAKVALPEYTNVSVENIKYYADEITWIKKISFDEGRIYLGYKKIDARHSSINVCMAKKIEDKRVGFALWTSKSQVNVHSLILKTIQILSEGIVSDLNRKVNPAFDKHLEDIFCFR